MTFDKPWDRSAIEIARPQPREVDLRLAEAAWGGLRLMAAGRFTVDAEGRVYLQESEVEQDVLIPRLVAVSEANPDLRVFVRGDRAINYGRVMEIMGMVSEAGFSKVALIAEIPIPGQPQN